MEISIHALRGEGDDGRYVKQSTCNQFQSTPSVGRATMFGNIAAFYLTISIHALRGEGDAGAHSRLTARYRNFNPRPPWGGRRLASPLLGAVGVISIHALRGEGDLFASNLAWILYISIHALRGEGDKAYRGKIDGVLTFQSTPSVGRATRDRLV